MQGNSYQVSVDINGMKAIASRARWKYYPSLAWILLVLCTLDALFTDIGLRSGIVYEANPVAAYLYNLNETYHIWFYAIKIALPLSAVWLAYHLKTSKLLYLYYIAISAYVIITLLHFNWVFLYLFSF